MHAVLIDHHQVIFNEGKEFALWNYICLFLRSNYILINLYCLQSYRTSILSGTSRCVQQLTMTKSKQVSKMLLPHIRESGLVLR